MSNSKKNKIRDYNDVKLYEQEVRVLEELETLLGEPIPHKDNIDFFTFGFSSENANVIRLSLPERQLSSIPKSLGSLKYLKVLSLHNNHLTSLPETIFFLTELKEFYLDNNQLTALLESISTLSKLEVLYLDNNQLTALPESISTLNNLKSLTLSDNPLKVLPEFLGNLSELNLLSLKNIQITTIPESVATLYKLEILILDENQLVTIPEFIGNLTELTGLHLENNQITVIPELIGNLTKLNSLSLANNQITSIPDSIGSLTKLRELYLERNQITSLPNSIGNLTELRELFLDNNRLKVLPNSIVNLINLRLLYLDDNQLKSLPESIDNLTELRELFLENNQLTTIPKSICNLSKLYALFLKNNQIKALEKDIWEFLSSFHPMGFSLSENSFETFEFKQIWRSLNRECEKDEKLRKFMEDIADSIFSEEQYQELVSIIEPESFTPKEDHSILLRTASAISRAFYGTLIGSGLIKFYNKILNRSMNILFFVVVLFILFLFFFIVNNLAMFEEGKVRVQRNTFINKAHRMIFYDVKRFQEILENRYYMLEYRMITVRYDIWIGFASNCIIASFTTICFALFATTSDFINFIVSPSQWDTNFKSILLLTFILMTLSGLILVKIRKEIPKLRSKQINELDQAVRNYEQLRQNIFQERSHQVGLP